MPGEHFPPLPLQDEGSLLGYLTQWYSKQTSKKGLGVLVAAVDTPEDQRLQAQYVCDGLDDDVQILAALNSLPAAGGEVVLLPGTYIISEDYGAAGPVFDLAGKSNVTIRGAGRQFTILKPPSTRAARVQWFFAGGAAGATGVTLSDMTLDGNEVTHANAYTDAPISFSDADNTNNKFLRLIVKNWDAAGGGGKCSDYSGSHSLWEDCLFTNNHHTALTMDSNYSVVDKCVFVENGEAEGEEGMTVNGSAEVPGVTVSNCRFLVHGNLEILSGAHKILNNHFESNVAFADNGWNAITMSNSPAGTILANNYVTGVGWAGVSIVGPDVIFANNTIVGTSEDGIRAHDRVLIVDNLVSACGQETDDTFAGISVWSGGSDEVYIAGNRVRHGGGATQHKYGIELITSSGSASGGHVIGQNDIRDSGRTADFLDAADGTIFLDNTQLDYAEITSDHTLTGSEADITGLSTATFFANSTYPRKVRVRAHFLTSNTSAGGNNKFNLKAGGTYLDEQNVDCAVTSSEYRVTLEWQGEITADTSWIVRGLEVSGAGIVEAAATHPAFIEVLQAGGHA